MVETWPEGAIVHERPAQPLCHLLRHRNQAIERQVEEKELVVARYIRRKLQPTHFGEEYLRLYVPGTSVCFVLLSHCRRGQIGNNFAHRGVLDAYNFGIASHAEVDAALARRKDAARAERPAVVDWGHILWFYVEPTRLRHLSAYIVEMRLD